MAFHLSVIKQFLNAYKSWIYVLDEYSIPNSKHFAVSKFINNPKAGLWIKSNIYRMCSLQSTKYHPSKFLSESLGDHKTIWIYKKLKKFIFIVYEYKLTAISWKGF